MTKHWGRLACVFVRCVDPRAKKHIFKSSSCSRFPARLRLTTSGVKSIVRLAGLLEEWLSLRITYDSTWSAYRTIVLYNLNFKAILTSCHDVAVHHRPQSGSMVWYQFLTRHHFGREIIPTTHANADPVAVSLASPSSERRHPPHVVFFFFFKTPKTTETIDSIVA